MIGNNTLRLNSATINEALQEYFDARLKDGAKVKVVNVSALPNTCGAPQFEVIVTNQVPVETPKNG